MRFRPCAYQLLTRGVLLAIVFGSTSCAPTPLKLHQPSHKKIATGSHRGEGREVLLVRPFADLRSQTVGEIRKNGHKVNPKNLYCDREPTAMLADLVASELAAVGFKVLGDRGLAGPSTLVLTGSVAQVFFEPQLNFFWTNFEADMELRLAATTESGLVAERTFYVKGEEAGFFSTSGNYQRSFDSGARQLVTSVVGAVANLADHFPAAPIAPMDPTNTSGIVSPSDSANTEGAQ